MVTLIHVQSKGVAMSERFELQGDQLVVDRETGLTWQRQGSPEPMVWHNGLHYVEKLNEIRFGGKNDWRYPNKDELATLITTEENRITGLYVDPLFGAQRSCWSSTEADHHFACYADFYYGDIYVVYGDYANYYVRAVRNG